MFRPVKTEQILQYTDTECGVVALAILFRYYRSPINFNDLREECAATRDGCAATTLLKVARGYGFEANAYRLEAVDFYHLKSPVICFWRFNHYIVFERMSKNKVYINDPAHGRMVISRDELDKCFTGVVLKIKPVIEIKHSSKKKRRLLKKDEISSRDRIFLGACLFLIIIMQLIQASVIQIMTHFPILKNVSEFRYWIGFSLVTGIMYVCMNMNYKTVEHRSLEKLTTTTLIKSIKKLYLLSFQFFVLRQKSEISHLLMSCELLIFGHFKSALENKAYRVAIVVCLILLFELSHGLFLITAMGAILCRLCFLLEDRRIQYEKSNEHHMGKLFSHTQNMIRNIEGIKASNLESLIFTRWEKLFNKKLKVDQKIQGYKSLTDVFRNSIATLSNFTLIFFGFYYLNQGSLSHSRFALYFFLNMSFFGFLNLFLQANRERYLIESRFDKFNELVLNPPDSRFQGMDNPDIDVSNVPFAVQCNNMTFSYNKHQHVLLRQVNLSIKHCHHVVFVGSTGCGKSTLTKLLTGLYAPSEGEILLFNNNIQDCSAHTLSQMVAYVSQHDSVFSETIFYNLTLGANVDPLLFQTSIQIACIDSWVESRGLNYWIKEGGSNLSGGERQRLNLARALIQNTPVLILDEATSAIDAFTEIKILENLKKLVNKTIIFVTHRLETLEFFDQIIHFSELNCG